MDDSKIKGIQIMIAGRSYSLKVVEQEVKMIEKVAREINQKINELQATYQANDKQDCLAMAVLTYAVELARKEDENSSAYMDRLSALQQDLQELL